MYIEKLYLLMNRLVARLLYDKELWMREAKRLEKDIDYYAKTRNKIADEIAQMDNKYAIGLKLPILKMYDVGLNNLISEYNYANKMINKLKS